MTAYDAIIAPFTDYAFMRRALIACMALALGGTPLGTFMALRRMALVGDAMSHAILPGVSIAFVFFGLAIWPMTFGGLAAGIIVSLAAVLLTRVTQLKEDASFTLSYLLSIATGVVILSLKGNNVDLLHLLFGNILAIDNDALTL
ncbi:MAG: metal ABC transporter permease, partial [Alphaproteobacteria bacterium]|nr:metal ABC transporter permease [Alphaproteobacteria bacterium]